MQSGKTAVLLVEDNAELRETLALRLRQEGYSVTVAESAEEGLEKLGTGSFALVLTDYQLPRETGAWMLGKAHAAGFLSGTGVLMMTGSRNPEGSERWKVLSKPVQYDDLLREVALAITRDHL